MENLIECMMRPFRSTTPFLGKAPELGWKMFQALCRQMQAGQLYWNGVMRYWSDFVLPAVIAQKSFKEQESDRLNTTPDLDALKEYNELLAFNTQIATRGHTHSFLAMNEYHLDKANEFLTAWLNTFSENGEEDIARFAERQAKVLDLVVNRYPEAIKNIEPYYGLHLETGAYVKAAETDRFTLYQVLPSQDGVEVKEDGKPVLIVPPYVLGANILAFLPDEDKSYVHCFANQGIPTYIRVVKDIHTTPAVQTMSGDDDTLDTRYFCEQLKARHGRPVTLNGFCQGGFMTLCTILSGEVDGLVDAHVTCASPMDGTRSKSLSDYLKHVPDRFRHLGYAVKTLANGNKVVDGEVMSWVYKLKSMDREAPMVNFYRDLEMFDRPDMDKVRISKTAAAINYWLLYDRTDLPVSVTEMSFDSYTKPISRDGTLPVKVLGRDLNLKHIEETGVSWLICIANKDDLVDPESALAPLDFVDAEVTVFPKGHASIATSWSVPTSECALHKCFPSPADQKTNRGPVCFHMALEEKLRMIEKAEALAEGQTEAPEAGLVENEEKSNPPNGGHENVQ